MARPNTNPDRDDTPPPLPEPIVLRDATRIADIDAIPGNDMPIEMRDELAPALTVPAGSTWLPPVTLSPAELDGHRPRVAVDSQGAAVVVWLSRDPGPDGTDRVRAAFRAPGGSFGQTNPILDADNGQPTPQIPILQVARDSQGNTLIVWTRSFGTSTSDRVQAAFIPADDQSAVADLISEDGQEADSPQVAFGRGGDALVVWRSHDGTNSRIQAAFCPAGDRFGQAQTISDPGQDAGFPRIAVNVQGTALAIWDRFDGTHRRVQAAFRPPGGRFGVAQTISAAGQDGFDPRVVFDSLGNATAVWEHSDGTNTRVQAAFRPAGGSFGPPQTISPLGQSGLLQVAVDAQGNTLIVWTDGRVLASFRPAGGSFGPPQSISPPGQGVGLPRVAVNPQGDAAAVWERLDGTNDRVQAAFRPAGGNFGPPQTISAAVPSAGVPEVAVDSQGNTVAIWTRLVGTNNRLEAAFRPAGGNFGQPQTISPDSDNAGSPEVVLDGQGNAIAIWTRRVDTNSRVEAAFRPAGGNFGPPQTISPAGQSAFSPNVAVDSLGNAIAVWTRSDGTNSRVQAAFRPAGGSFGPPQTISPVGHNAYSARIVFDSQGNALGFWESDNTTENRIRVAFRPAGGTFGPPQAISAAGQFAYSPQVAFESQGSSIALWSHFDGTNRVVQAAFGAAGGSFGPPQTISGASLPGEPDLGDLEPRLAVDSQGNAIAVWRRFDGTHSRVQAAFRPVGGNFGPP